ncbi:MAG: hypothetical protein IJU71_01195, partial [Selenomonadaceae bacterium]|nr:hypothetical protein [Selenomonadaceae bacterium]
GEVFPFNELIGVYKAHPLRPFIETISADSVDKFDKNYVFYRMYDGQRTVPNADSDHVHPKSLLSVRYGDDYRDKINNIANLQLLDDNTNRNKKRARELKDWLSNEVTDKNIYIDRHLIPHEQSTWEIDGFDEFLDKRSSLIADKLSSY